MRTSLHQSETAAAPGGSPEAQAQRNEQLLGMFEASFMNGDLRGAMSTGLEMLGINEMANGDYPYREGYTVKGKHVAGSHISVHSIGNDRSDLFGSGRPDPVIAWAHESEAGRPTSPTAMAAMQTVLRDGLGRYSWRYDNSRKYRGERGGFAGATTLGSDLMMQASEFESAGSRGQESIALMQFMQHHGYAKSSRSAEPRLLQWCDGFDRPEDRGRFRGVIGSLLNDDPRELSRQASTDISAPQMVMSGLSRSMASHPYASTPANRTELVAMLQGLDRGTEEGSDMTLEQTVAAYHARGEQERDAQHPAR